MRYHHISSKLRGFFTNSISHFYVHTLKLTIKYHTIHLDIFCLCILIFSRCCCLLNVVCFLYGMTEKTREQKLNNENILKKRNDDSKLIQYVCVCMYLCLQQHGNSMLKEYYDSRSDDIQLNFEVLLLRKFFLF